MFSCFCVYGFFFSFVRRLYSKNVGLKGREK